ncbi:Zn-dependent hydrolase [Acidiferrimicrobium sp. IK]|uniref:Zn-dependent hydrolase n=1 Tax=Acidiferrimicrobium sp. IK TaxID=2871700 RepID=UPI0021CB0B74|nr:Zn-dependent hydrolase [Acidiferrimicrobium sp. IK]MCU4184502.1 Zn-dependent hydrolase [Acidiferrimicrobium sp. IK]
MREVDGDRLVGDLARLGLIGRDVDGGVTRLAWSAEDRQAVGLVGSWAAETGAAVTVDPAGTLVADIPGREPGLRPLVVGSHLDTVVGAGRLDGAYGVVAAVRILAAAADTGLRHPLRVAAFANEEGVVAPPFTGSRAAAGHDVTAELDHPGPDGVTLRARMAGAGCDPERLARAAWGPLAGYLELHIEQGPVLDAGGQRAAVVTAISGQVRARVEWSGRANHAGTTPMDLRCDALVAAAHGVLAVERLALDGLVAVATVGRLNVEPGAPNVIPSKVSFTVDVRSVDGPATAKAMARLQVDLTLIAQRSGTRVDLFPTSESAPVPTDPAWRRLLRAASNARGVAAVDLASGAGHDAQHMAAAGPAGMLFVPSVGGVSHHHSEDTAEEDLVLGAQIGLDALLAADLEFDA